MKPKGKGGEKRNYNTKQLDKLVVLVVAKWKLDSKVWPEESVSGLVKLSFVHDCFLNGDLHVLLFKEKVSSFGIVCFGTYV